MRGGGGNKKMLISRGGVEISKFLFPGGGGVEISTAFNFCIIQYNLEFSANLQTATF